jgi:arylsulfatase A-like enzyme
VSLPVLRTTSVAASLIAALLWAASGCAPSGERGAIGAGQDAQDGDVTVATDGSGSSADGIAAAGSGASEGEGEGGQRPNVLLICVDDLRPELSCLGSTWVRTPNMDRLAADGVAFRNHFVAVPTCGASRYALLTGRSPASSGVTKSNNAFYGADWSLPADSAASDTDGARSLPELFRRNGWRTEAIGKISHTPDGRVFAYDGSGDGRLELPGAWDELSTPYGPWGRGWGAFFGYAGGRHREDGSGYRPQSEFTAETDDELPDGLIARQAVSSLEALAAGDSPFFLAVGFSKPHLPFVATAGDREVVKAWGVTAAPHPAPTTSAYAHRSGEFYAYQHEFERVDRLPDGVQGSIREAYAACVRFVDRQVGRVLDAVDELGLAGDTIVVLWSDHGWHLGDSAMWGKHTPHERALRSPLIVRAPGVGRAGVVSEALVESIDLLPTLAELAGIDPAAMLSSADGLSLAPLLDGRVTAIRDHALSFWGDALSLRTPTHRLVVNVSYRGGTFGAELYDMRVGEDPVEDLAAARPDLVEAAIATLEERLGESYFGGKKGF